MAQFGFENDIHSILKLDMPITNAPVIARWQRKGSSSNTAAALSSLSPGKPANLSQSSSKTPSKTPGGILFIYLFNWCCASLDAPQGNTNLNNFLLFLHIVGKNKKTPSKMGGDRYIPIRNSKQMDVANYLLTKENEPVGANATASTVSKLVRFLYKLLHNAYIFIHRGHLYLKENQKFWSISLNGYNINDAKILHLGGQPLNAPEGNDLHDSVHTTIWVSTVSVYAF